MLRNRIAAALKSERVEPSLGSNARSHRRYAHRPDMLPRHVGRAV